MISSPVLICKLNQSLKTSTGTSYCRNLNGLPTLLTMISNQTKLHYGDLHFSYFRFRIHNSWLLSQRALFGFNKVTARCWILGWNTLRSITLHTGYHPMCELVYRFPCIFLLKWSCRWVTLTLVLRSLNGLPLKSTSNRVLLWFSEPCKRSWTLWSTQMCKLHTVFPALSRLTTQGQTRVIAVA